GQPPCPSANQVAPVYRRVTLPSRAEIRSVVRRRRASRLSAVAVATAAGPGSGWSDLQSLRACSSLAAWSSLAEGPALWPSSMTGNESAVADTDSHPAEQTAASSAL